MLLQFLQHNNGSRSRIYASRKVAEKIEIQTRYSAELFYNVDVRQDQRYLAEKDLSAGDESRSLPTLRAH